MEAQQRRAWTERLPVALSSAANTLLRRRVITKPKRRLPLRVERAHAAPQGRGHRTTGLA